MIFITNLNLRGLPRQDSLTWNKIVMILPNKSHIAYFQQNGLTKCCQTSSAQHSAILVQFDLNTTQSQNKIGNNIGTLPNGQFDTKISSLVGGAKLIHHRIYLCVAGAELTRASTTMPCTGMVCISILCSQSRPVSMFHSVTGLHFLWQE